MLKKILECLDKTVVTDVSVYDMKELTPFYDYSIIASASSARQAMATINNLKDEAELLGLNVRSYSTSSDSAWFIIDLDEIVVHVFVGNERERYNLDGMYKKITN